MTEKNTVEKSVQIILVVITLPAISIPIRIPAMGVPKVVAKPIALPTARIFIFKTEFL